MCWSIYILYSGIKAKYNVNAYIYKHKCRIISINGGTISDLWISVPFHLLILINQLVISKLREIILIINTVSLSIFCAVPHRDYA